MLSKTDPELLKQLDAGVDLTKPSLKGLSYLLRNPQLWPKGFEWDYSYINSCAIGLSYDMWDQHPTTYARFDTADSDYLEIFYDQRVRTTHWLLGLIPFVHKRRMAEVPPTQVADAIDRYLATA